jgi:hypothetical protein
VIYKINLPPKGHAPKEKKEGKALKKEIGDTLKK